MNFEEAVLLVGVSEGKYSSDPKDRGNWTTGQVGSGIFKGSKFGISAMTYPHLDIKNLTWEQAKSIYLTDFWNRYKIPLLKPDLRLFVFDSIINHGPSGGIKLLQRAAKVSQDGVIGSNTIQASLKVTVWDMAQARSDYYVEITQNGFNDENDQAQLKGWLRRNLRVLRESIA